jgi:copper oxidase (laccase) domain-containing protein
MDQGTRRFLDPAGSGRWKMNLTGINRHQLINAGIEEGNVTLCSPCTCCRKDLFFSVRAEGDPTGRQIGLIGMRPESSRR